MESTTMLGSFRALLTVVSTGEILGTSTMFISKLLLRSNYSSGMKQHIRLVHLGMKPTLYTCSECDYKGSSKSVVKRKTSKKTYFC